MKALSQRGTRAYRLGFLVLAGALGACATAPAPPLDSAGAVAAVVTVSDTEFDAFRTYIAPTIKSEIPRGGGLYPYNDDVRMTLSFLRHKQTGNLMFLLNVLVEYKAAWRFYESASLPGGTILPTKAVNRNVGSCSGALGCDFRESVVFDLPLNVVDAAARSGLSLRLNAKQGPDILLTVPSAYLIGVVQASLSR